MLWRAQDPEYGKRDDDRRYELDERGAEVRQAALNTESEPALRFREVVIGGCHESREGAAADASKEGEQHQHFERKSWVRYRIYPATKRDEQQDGQGENQRR